MISNLNRRITVNKYSFSQDSSGGNTKSVSSSYDVWASVTQKSGSRTLDNGQIQYTKVYEIVKRYESSRELSNNDEIVYDGETLSIAMIKINEEGKKKFEIITAYK